jgi:ABC-type arginine transport system permease subunit
MIKMEFEEIKKEMKKIEERITLSNDVRFCILIGLSELLLALNLIGLVSTLVIILLIVFSYIFFILALISEYKLSKINDDDKNEK